MRQLFFVFSLFSTLAASAAAFTNPILYEDYSDPDPICVGEDYWMTASSFQCWPGLPVLHSYDLVHWEVVNNAIQGFIPGGTGQYPIEHGNQVWAPSIRFHDGLFYIMWGDPDIGIFEVHTSDPRGRWSEPRLIIFAKGYIDACPFWDEDGRTYIVHALANSRAGMKSVLLLTEVNADFTRVIRPSKIFFDGHTTQPTCEGPKLYKRDGYYYVFFPAGGVPTGWQTVIRSRSLSRVFDDDFSPAEWEERIVMAQQKTPVNGPHQGGWVHTPAGQDWFIHFQDVGPLGRILHLQPMQWRADGWPVIGSDKDGDGCGCPVAKADMPKLTARQKALAKADSRKQPALYSPGLGNLAEWQWQRMPSRTRDGKLHSLLLQDNLRCIPAEEGPNRWQDEMILRKITGPNIDYTTQVIFRPSKQGDRLGFTVFGMDYAALELVMMDDGSISLDYVTCADAHKGKKEEREPLTGWINQVDKYTVLPMEKMQIFLRVSVRSSDPQPGATDADKIVKAVFSYSTDGIHFTKAPEPFLVKEGKWIGAKVGFYALSDHPTDATAKVLTFRTAVPKK